jgi:hypothetical protein
MTTTTLIEADIRHDATDCRTAFEAGQLALRGDAQASPAPSPTAAADIDFGDDASPYANDGACDDRRSTGTGMTTTGLIGSDVRHDATDCRAALQAGTVTFRFPPSAAAVAAAAGIAFGDDTSDYANNGVCDDSRFTGSGMTTSGLIDADVGHDAADCRMAFEAGQLTLR